MGGATAWRAPRSSPKSRATALMQSLAVRHPAYRWSHNIGYATAEHLGGARPAGRVAAPSAVILERGADAADVRGGGDDGHVVRCVVPMTRPAKVADAKPVPNAAAPKAAPPSGLPRGAARRAGRAHHRRRDRHWVWDRRAVGLLGAHTVLASRNGDASRRRPGGSGRRVVRRVRPCWMCGMRSRCGR